MRIDPIINQSIELTLLYNSMRKKKKITVKTKFAPNFQFSMYN